MQPGLEWRRNRVDSEPADKDVVEQRWHLDAVPLTPTLPVRGAAERVVEPLEPDIPEDRIYGLQLALETATWRTCRVEVAKHDDVRITRLFDPSLDPRRQLPVLAPAVRKVLRPRL